jgi:hypothetical protein
MHFQTLTLLMICIVISIIVAVGIRAYQASRDEADTFMVSPIYGCTMIVLGLVFYAAPYSLGIGGTSSPSLVIWCFAPFWLGAFIAAIYFLLYQVTILDQDTFTVGAFRQRVIRRSEIIDWDFIQWTRNSELWVHLKSGTKVRLLGLLNDFDELAQMMYSEMASHHGLTRKESGS